MAIEKKQCPLEEARTILGRRMVDPALFYTGKETYLSFQKFQIHELRTRYPDQLLYFCLPRERPRDRKFPLVVMLHGGGINPDRPNEYFDRPEHAEIGQIFRPRQDVVTVGPSIFPVESDGWCRAAAEEYLAAVILESHARFGIDLNRIYLSGCSMGGFGAYHIMQCYPDRFAAIQTVVGAWSQMIPRQTTSIPIWVLHGIKDAVYRERPHFTDIAYARIFRDIMQRDKMNLTYQEYDGGHEYESKGTTRFLDWAAAGIRRDQPPRVFLASPTGWSAQDTYPAKHRFWLSLDEPTSGTIVHDVVRSEGPCGGWNKWDFSEEEWNAWHLIHSRQERPGAYIDGSREGNKFTLTCRNVRSLTVWMNEEMVDFDRPVEILVNGNMGFSDRLTPATETGIASYSRRHDLGLIYTAKAEIKEVA